MGDAIGFRDFSLQTLLSRKDVFFRLLAAVSLGIAAPLYQTAAQLRGQFPLTFLEALVLIGLLQLLLPAALFILCLIAGRFAKWIEVTVYAVAALVLLRVAQTLFSTFTTPLSVKVLFISVGFLACGLVYWRYRTIMKDWLGKAGQLSLLMGVGLLATAVVWQQTDNAPVQSAAPPVILVVMDEMSFYDFLTPKGEIDGVRFPNFKALSEDSVWFRNTTANYAFTVLSFPSFFNGTLDAAEVDPRPVRSTLIKTFSEHGYRISMVSPVFGCDQTILTCKARPSANFSWHSIENLFAFTTSPIVPYQFVPRIWPALVTGVINERANYALGAVQNVDNGSLTLLHTMITHDPPVFRADGQVRAISFGTPELPGGDITRANYTQARRASLQYADAWLGRIIGVLKRRGVWNHAVMAVIADHGHCFTEDCRRVGLDTIKKATAELAFVPFFLHAPNLPARIDDRPAQLVDLLPTLLGASGLKSAKPLHLDGEDLLQLLPQKQRRRQIQFIDEQRRTFADLPPGPPADRNMGYDAHASSSAEP